MVSSPCWLVISWLLGFVRIFCREVVSNILWDKWWKGCGMVLERLWHGACWITCSTCFSKSWMRFDEYTMRSWSQGVSYQIYDQTREMKWWLSSYIRFQNVRMREGCDDHCAWRLKLCRLYSWCSLSWVISILQMKHFLLKVNIMWYVLGLALGCLHLGLEEF